MGKLADRVKETTTTTGTGAVTLAGAVVGFQSFISAFNLGDVVSYCITDGTDWEVGHGTLASGSLERTTVLSSSNANALVSFAAGSKDVFCTATSSDLSPLPIGRTEETQVATAGQTAFTVAYPVGNLDVFLNGVRLLPSDFTATNGTSVTLATGAALNDEVTFVKYGSSQDDGPCFIATQTTPQPFTSATWTKIAYNSEVNDTNSCYDPTLYRFTPNVAGFYQLNAHVCVTSSTPASIAGIGFYKNGSMYKVPTVPYSTINSGTILEGSSLVYCNGTTDFVEAYVYNNGASPSVSGIVHENQFSAHLVRRA